MENVLRHDLGTSDVHRYICFKYCRDHYDMKN